MNDNLFDPARLPARDEIGMTYHPDLDNFLTNVAGATGPELAGDDDCWFHQDAMREAGWQLDFVSFESDASEELQDRYDAAGEPDVSYWTPTTPEGEGWLMVAVYDTEDGPVALFVRRLQ